MELRHTIKLIRELDAEIAEIETEIKKIMDSIDSPTLSVPGISYALGSVIISEVGDFSRFDNPDKLLAFAGCSPSTYQSGQIYSTHAKMEKRGSKYLRWALLNAAKYVCKWEPTFAVYLRKKLAEGKHYNVAVSHAAKKLVRLLYHLETTGEKYIPQTLSEPELTNTYCTSRRSVPLTNRSIQMLQFFKTRAHSGFVVLLSPSPSLSFLSICMLFVKGGAFFTQSSFGGLTFNS